jgi:hypothetical protein
MSAVHRLLAAVSDRDDERVGRELAEDVEFRTAFGREPVRGRAAVAGALTRLDRALDGVEHRILVGPVRQRRGGGIYAIVSRVVLDGELVDGVDLLVLDDDGRICRLTATGRPREAVRTLAGRVAAPMELGASCRPGSHPAVIPSRTALLLVSQ